MNKTYKVIVCHPHKQHSFELAHALKKNDLLFKYITTVYDSNDSFTRILKKFLKGDALKKANSRKSNRLSDSEVLRFYELEGLLFLLFSRISFLKEIAKRIDLFTSKRFGVKVAKYAIKNKVDAVICYDRYATSCFEYLKENNPNIIRIIDMTIISPAYMKSIFEKDMQNTGDVELQLKFNFLWNDKIMNLYKREIENANYFLAGSNGVKKSLIFYGISEDNIKVVPYGVDIEQFNFKQNEIIKRPLKLIFVGQINQRKGIHHLIKVMNKFSSDEVELLLVGSYSRDSKIYTEGSKLKNVSFYGFATRDVLSTLYQQNDIFILPSLGEGMALVGLEALSCGKPLICSDESGINDVIVDGYNGFVYPTGDLKKLEDCIRWFIDNPNYISQTSINSRRTAEQLTWHKYYQNVSFEIKNILINNSTFSVEK